MAELEKDMEEKLITQLTQGRSQWTYRPDIRTEADLWANFRKKLECNNLALLDGEPLTDGEFEQVKQFILDNTTTPYYAAVWLAGENGIAQIPLVREDASKGTVHLEVINNREIAGGKSSYEVINQYVSDKADDRDRKRRFDVTLLINGLPMIQIELKNRMHPYLDAFRQIQKYSEQGKFRGLFGTLQMFVVTNGVDTRYIAADTSDKLNENFLSTWVDKDNNRVGDYLEFANQVLHIPEAHMLVGQYSVLDTARKRLILLRPYQIHAIEAVRKQSCSGESGYVWHTTGSGKTLTSYTVTKNLLNIPSVDKTVFLIDRKDLDNQTTMEFQAYAENDTVDVDDTKSTRELLKKLTDKSRKAIVTTIQKLQIIMKRSLDDKYKDSSKTKRLQSLKICFVVDECHRTVSPETKRKIEQFFANSLWVGFTGTPIFSDNKRARKGDLARTTEEEYGSCVHRYTVKEALHDNAVLGFQIEYIKAITDDELKRVAKELLDALHAPKSGETTEDKEKREQALTDAKESVDKLARADLEKLADELYTKVKHDDMYAGKNHKLQIIDFICNNVAGKLHLSAPEGQAYESILTTASIKDAQEYYALFREFIADGGVAESIKAKLPDFPKIAITYTVGENDDKAKDNQKLMQQSLDDYNAMFGTKFTMEDGLKAYNKDLNDRLARKKSRYAARKEQLDLVIVVDRLLTGFDAPSLSTLFIDRAPMAPQNLIQAFSRTNRLYDKSKRFGQIVICRMPGMYEKAIDKAFLLYSSGGETSVTAPTFAESKTRFTDSITELRKFVQVPKDAEQLKGDTEAMKKYAKLFQKFDRAYGEVQIYLEWEPERLEADFHITADEIEEYTGHYKNIIEELRKLREDEEDIDIDVEYELESVKITEINYRYLIALIQSHVPDVDDLGLEPVKDEKIDEYIKSLQSRNPKLAAVVAKLWDEIQKSPDKFRGKQIMQVIDNRIKRAIRQKIKDFAAEWCADVDSLMFQAYQYRPGKELDIALDYVAYSANHSGENKLNKLRYKKQANKNATALLATEIRPLLEK